MNQTIEKKESQLINDARRVFSNACVEQLAEAGLDFLEGDSQGAFTYDLNGNKYLDAYASAGSCNLGRRPEPIANALQSIATETDQGNFVLISEEKTAAAERLAEFMPRHLSSCYFTVVRGEAVEAACKIARGKTGRSRLVSFKGNYHGEGGFALSLSSSERKKMYEPLIPEIDILKLNDMNVISRVVNEQTAGVVVEPVQVENGCRVATTEFLKELAKQCKRVGALLIMDETQTGFGRTGRPFGMDHSGIKPDILIFGEAICGGMFNLCGLSFTPDVKSFFDEHPLIHLCTFGGHDIGCRVAIQALDLYDEIQPWYNAARLEKQFSDSLSAVKEKGGDQVESVSALGLLGAIQFDSKETAARFCRETIKNGAIVKQGVIDPASVIVRPVLTIEASELKILESAMSNAAEQL